MATYALVPDRPGPFGRADPTTSRGDMQQRCLLPYFLNQAPLAARQAGQAQSPCSSACRHSRSPSRPYRCVVWTEACPNNRWTAKMSTPWLTSLVAQACRRSWTRASMLAALQSTANRLSTARTVKCVKPQRVPSVPGRIRATDSCRWARSGHPRCMRRLRSCRRRSPRQCALSAAAPGPGSAESGARAARTDSADRSDRSDQAPVAGPSSCGAHPGGAAEQHEEGYGPER